MQRAKFKLGQIVTHRNYGYRGIVVDVDPMYEGSEDWYEEVAVSRPDRSRPWYHVLVDEHEHETYVAEEHLERDESGQPVVHPDLDLFVSGDIRRGYTSRHTFN
ncbi:MAG: heat shock protein HspQ [Pseudomonadota bacterium]